MWTAILFLIPALVCLTILELFLQRAASHDAALDWSLDHVYLPLLRILLLLGFITLGYPEILNIPNAPTFSAVLNADSHRLSHWVNLAFVAGLVLPLTPILGRLPAPLFSLQAVLAITLLFCWTADAMGRDVSAWPGQRIFGGYLLVAIGGYYGFRQILTTLWRNDQITAPLQQTVLDIALIFSQLPAIWFYARGLGQQLH